MTDFVALIVDIVRSRDLADRAAAQSAIPEAFDIAVDGARIPQSLRSTVGDEFQAVFSDVSSALRVTGLLRLSLPDGVDCRFGFGRGEVRDVADRNAEGRDVAAGDVAARNVKGRDVEGWDVDARDAEDRSGGTIQDGSAWWRARQAIEEAHRREDRKNPALRGWFISETPSSEFDALVNAFLLMRDSVIGPMRARERRLAAGALLGRSQSDLARDEKITQPAVSQNLQRSGGAALLAAQQLFDRVSRDEASR